VDPRVDLKVVMTRKIPGITGQWTLNTGSPTQTLLTELQVLQFMVSMNTYII